MPILNKIMAPSSHVPLLLPTCTSSLVLASHLALPSQSDCSSPACLAALFNRRRRWKRFLGSVLDSCLSSMARAQALSEQTKGR